MSCPFEKPEVENDSAVRGKELEFELLLGEELLTDKENLFGTFTPQTSKLHSVKPLTFQLHRLPQL